MHIAIVSHGDVVCVSLCAGNKLALICDSIYFKCLFILNNFMFVSTISAILGLEERCCRDVRCRVSAWDRGPPSITNHKPRTTGLECSVKKVTELYSLTMHATLAIRTHLFQTAFQSVDVRESVEERWDCALKFSLLRLERSLRSQLFISAGTILDEVFQTNFLLI